MSEEQYNTMEIMARPRAVPGLDMLQIMPSQEPGWEAIK